MLSRALLAVALTAPSSSPLWRTADGEQPQLSTASKAIISGGDKGKWAVINFSCVEESLAAKITDDDIYAMLACIDAVNKLKRLKLGGCNNITAIGLERLRGSAILEQFDLGKRIYGSKISGEIVLPILHSIVRADGNSLKHVNLPWKSVTGARTLLDPFLGEYNQLLRMESCYKCDGVLQDRQLVHHEYGYQEYTCYSCLNHFCNSGDCSLNSCRRCCFYFCEDCETLCQSCGQCSGCTGSITTGCGLGCGRLHCVEWCIKTCEPCNRTGCTECLDFRQCDGNDCGEAHCGDCFDDDDVSCDVQRCEECDDLEFCSECFVMDCEQSNIHDGCEDCVQRFLPIVARIRGENERLRQEVEELRRY